MIFGVNNVEQCIIFITYYSCLNKHKMEQIRMKISFILKLGNNNRVSRHKYGDIRDYKKKI